MVPMRACTLLAARMTPHVCVCRQLAVMCADAARSQQHSGGLTPAALGNPRRGSGCAEKKTCLAGGG